MQHTIIAFFVFLIAVSVTACSDKAAQSEVLAADRVITNATVYTLDPANPVAQAVAVRDGHIVAVGNTAAIADFIGEKTRVENMQGAYVYPGFADAHVHLSGVGKREFSLNLAGVGSLAQLKKRVAERAEQVAKGEWIVGRGWIETHWEPPVFPTRVDLDAIAPDNPVWLVRADGHAGVANSAALALAGITAETEAPFGGKILRDEQGQATGVLLDNAMALVTAKIPAITPTQRRQFLISGAQYYASQGWTQAQIAGNSLQDVTLIQDLYAQNKIGIRIYNAVLGPSEDAWRLIRDKNLVRYGSPEKSDNRFVMRTIKVSVDGALGSRGAAMFEPYNDADTSGFMTWKAQDVLPLFKAALKAGIQIETHAIGDRANRLVLNWYEQAFNAVPPEERAITDPRWRIEHAQILKQADVSRFAELGVIPSMQPSHAIGDLFFAPSRIGLERLKHAYAWQELLKTGVPIACGSDAPVEKGDPRIEFYAAVTRRSLDGFSGPGWHPEQAMTRQQALKCLTLWPAYAAFQEDVRGSISKGKYADFTVLDTDLLNAAPRDILAAQVLYTIVAGEVVYQGAEPGVQQASNID